jgi:hypothetical protein
MEIPVLPDHDLDLSEKAHADKKFSLGLVNSVRYDQENQLVYASFDLTPECVEMIKDGKFTGISYSIGYITEDSELNNKRTGSTNAFQGRVLMDYYDHVAFLVGKQQNHTGIGRPIDLLGKPEDFVVQLAAGKRPGWNSKFLVSNPVQMPETILSASVVTQKSFREILKDKIKFYMGF